VNKEQMDKLYYLLREVSNEGHRQQSTEITDAVYGLAQHLLAGRDYLRLIQYSRYYGEKFLLKPTFEAILGKEWVPSRFVEFGAGLGWLCRGLASRFKIPFTLTVDKRPWIAIDVLADLETIAGINDVYTQLEKTDIIVMSDFLHCVANPSLILEKFSRWPIAILEYAPTDYDWDENYTEQLKRYGGNPLCPEEIADLYEGTHRHTDIIDLDPYILVLIDAEDQ